MKICRKCGQGKPLDEFHKETRSSDGRRSHCKECIKEYMKKNYKYDKKRKKQYYQDNKDKFIKYSKQYYQDNKNQRNEYQKQYRQDNRDKFIKYSKQHYQDNLKYYKEYYEENKGKLKDYNKQYIKQRRANDPLFKLKHNISCLFRTSIKNQGYSKNSKTFEILGCSFEHLMNWLDFEKWNNEDCHIDHIIPISLAKNEEEVLLLNHYTNLQVLSAEDNLKKGNRHVKFENLIKVVNNHPEPTKITEILNNSSIDLL